MSQPAQAEQTTYAAHSDQTDREHCAPTQAAPTQTSSTRAASRENSLYAFKQAVDLGYRYLETDVHATADDQLIAFHDDVLDRVTDAVGAVRDLPLKRVLRARIGGLDPIPTLDELLEACPDARLNIDIKAPAAASLLSATIRRHRAWDRVCVASFSLRRLNLFRRSAERPVAMSFVPSQVAWSAFVPLLPHWLNGPGQAIQVPATTHLAGQRVTIVNRNLIRVARSRNLRIHVWTVNNSDQMHRLIDLGVDGLISDRIDVLKAVAQSRGVWS